MEEIRITWYNHAIKGDMKGATNINKIVPIKLRFYVDLQDTYVIMSDIL